MDQELVQYLTEQFTRVDQRFDRVEQRLDGHDQRFDRIDQRLDAHDQRFSSIDQRFDGVKRHNGILIKDLRYQVRLVAEGFTTFVDGRYTQDQARIDERFRETQALLRTSFEHLARQDDQLRQRVENRERNDQN
jgi:chromosome segregation ATPase